MKTLKPKLLLFLFLALSQAQQQKKNVLLIVGDDIGWSDLGFVDPTIITPNINRLVKTGVLLNNTYTSSICTPSRNSILSGVYPEHTGLQHDVILPEQPVGLNLSLKLLPQYFKDNGYKTHMIGKWHLGFCKKEYTPVNRGFDSFYGYFNAQEDYYTHRVPEFLVLPGNDGLDFWNQTSDYLKPVLDKNETYSMFAFRDRALDILQKHDKQEPFFMYFASQNCHLPNQVPIEYENKYSNIQDENRRKYLGMITFLDDVIGNLTSKLEELGLLQNTLIAFISDNGGAVYSSGRNYPLRGGKLTAFEGGHRVRAFLNGPGLKSNVYNGLIHSTDLLPTLLNAAIPGGIQTSGIDGVNQLLSILDDLPSNRTSFIYNIDPLGYAGCNYMKSFAIREGDWKLIEGCPGVWDQWYPEPTFDAKFLDIYNKRKFNKNFNVPHGTFLFNIKQDPLEKNNLAQSQPDIVKKLSQKLDEYRKNVVYPLNPPWKLPDPKASPKKWHDTWSPGWC